MFGKSAPRVITALHSATLLNELDLALVPPIHTVAGRAALPIFMDANRSVLWMRDRIYRRDLWFVSEETSMAVPGVNTVNRFPEMGIVILQQFQILEPIEVEVCVLQEDSLVVVLT